MSTALFTTSLLILGLVRGKNLVLGAPQKPKASNVLRPIPNDQDQALSTYYHNPHPQVPLTQDDFDAFDMVSQVLTWPFHWPKIIQPRDQQTANKMTDSHFGASNIQFSVDYFPERDTLSIYFEGTDPSKGRWLQDVVIDLQVTHKAYPLQLRNRRSKSVRIHSGVAQRIIENNEFHKDLLKSLRSVKERGIGKDQKQARWKKGNFDSKSKLLISGHSLGGGYAIALGLVLRDFDLGGSITMQSKKQRGPLDRYPSLRALRTQLLPMMDNGFRIVSLGAPLVVFHEDVQNIEAGTRQSIFNIITPKDPIPMLLGGENKATFTKDFTIAEVMRTLLKTMATRANNGPIGSYFILARDLTTKKVWRFEELDTMTIQKHLQQGAALFNANFEKKNLPNLILNFHANDNYKNALVYISEGKHWKDNVKVVQKLSKNAAHLLLDDVDEENAYEEFEEYDAAGQFGQYEEGDFVGGKSTDSVLTNTGTLMFVMYSLSILLVCLCMGCMCGGICGVMAYKAQKQSRFCIL